MQENFPKVRVHLLPVKCDLPQTAKVAVIVDVLRASTTIASALSNGAVALIPCLSIDDARDAASTANALLGGERGGVKVEGFDCGNSPTEYTSELVKSRTIAFTTTNGTKALHKSLKADTILVGSFVNLSAIVAACQSHNADVDIVCAGTDGSVSGEDVLFAGMLAQRLIGTDQFAMGNDSAVIAIDFSIANTENSSHLLDAIRASQGGRNLIALGYDADIEFAANVDRFSIVPTYCPQSGSIKPG